MNKRSEADRKRVTAVQDLRRSAASSRHVRADRKRTRRDRDRRAIADSRG